MKRFIEKGGIVFLFSENVMSDLMMINDSHLFLYSLCCSITYLIASGTAVFICANEKEACNTI